jgi:hypothetical protein
MESMKIMKYWLLVAFTSVFIGKGVQAADHTAEKNHSDSTGNKKLNVLEIVTTAMNTSLRLAVSGTAEFHKGAQPMENVIFIFVNPDDSLTTVILNTSDKAIDFNFFMGGLEAEWSIPARAIQTVVY